MVVLIEEKRGPMRGRTILLMSLMLIVASCARQAAPVSPPVQQPAPLKNPRVERITTAVPFPRGLQLVDGDLYVLARGRVRESGGVSGDIDDKAGTIYRVDPDIAEPISSYEISPKVRGNGEVFAAPTSPPFKLFDRTASPPTRDRETDRPYCSLRYDDATKSFYVCAFSGIDKAEGSGSNFSKNTADAVFRFDTRTSRWYEVERHSLEAGGNYPHHDPAAAKPPHGRLNGPDNCLVVGRWLYCVAKDNSLLARYDLAEIAKNPDAGPPPSHWVLNDKINLKGRAGVTSLQGHSMLACRDGYLYIGYRTSSAIVRIPLDADGLPRQPIVGELLAQFDPYDPATRKSANLTDMVFGPDGSLYVVSAQPARIYRFMPDPQNVFDARTAKSPAWADMAQLTGNAKMKSENVLVDDRGRLYVTSGDAYDFQNGAGGVVYRVTPK
jgi:hypothetical protein